MPLPGCKNKHRKNGTLSLESEISQGAVAACDFDLTLYGLPHASVYMCIVRTLESHEEDPSFLRIQS